MRRPVLGLLLLSAVMTCGNSSSSLRLALRVCFKDSTQPDKNECAYCNPRTLMRTMRNCTSTQDGLPDMNPDILWTETQKRCILRTCRQQRPSQKVLPTLFPLDIR